MNFKKLLLQSQIYNHTIFFQHGALTGAEDMDVLQIQLGDIY